MSRLGSACLVACGLIMLGLLAGLIGVACDTGLDFPERDAEPSLLCIEARDHSDFPWLRENVFKRSCTFSSCHTGSRPKGELNLTTTRAYDELVGVSSITQPDQLLVEAMHPERSYLLVKLGRNPGPLGDGGTLMPSRNELLCAEKIDAVERWIAQGALEVPLPDAGPPDAGVPDASPVDASFDASVDAAP